jgi:hypothetical protein
LNPTCMWFILHLLMWKDLHWVKNNDSVCYTQVPAHVLLLRNYRKNLSKNKISSCIPHRYMLKMVDHPIIITVSTQTTNEIQLITHIYVRWDVLFKVKLLYYMVYTMFLNRLKKYEGDNCYYVDHNNSNKTIINFKSSITIILQLKKILW